MRRQRQMCISDRCKGTSAAGLNINNILLNAPAVAGGFYFSIRSITAHVALQYMAQPESQWRLHRMLSI